MTIELPAAIAGYYEADRIGDAVTLADCFTADAVVRDEGHTYTGRDEIREWKACSSAKYSYSVEPFSLVEDDGRTIVTSHLVGDFPGSPVDLRYLFTLTADGISALEIKP